MELVPNSLFPLFFFLAGFPKFIEFYTSHLVWTLLYLKIEMFLTSRFEDFKTETIYS